MASEPCCCLAHVSRSYGNTPRSRPGEHIGATSARTAVRVSQAWHDCSPGGLAKIKTLKLALNTLFVFSKQIVICRWAGGWCSEV